MYGKVSDDNMRLLGAGLNEVAKISNANGKNVSKTISKWNTVTNRLKFFTPEYVMSRLKSVNK